MGYVTENLLVVKKRIHSACEKCGRDPADVDLIAVSKTHSAELVREAYQTGQRIFGESYVQEFVDKAEKLSDLEIEWHFIGHLQRNKVKYIIDKVSLIHSLDSVKLAEEIEKRAKHPINCLVEINLAGERSKTGISPDKLEELLTASKQMKNINVIGLMTMPPYDDNAELSRPYFKKLHEIFSQYKFKELSMGMTGDLEVAIEEGSTMVRVGTAIFGTR